MFLYRNVKVLRVVDGDTIDVEIDVGFKFTTRQRFRLYGINTQETRTRDKLEKKGGTKAKLWLRNKLRGKQIAIETKKQEKYGRYLAVVYVDGVNINQDMVN